MALGGAIEGANTCVGAEVVALSDLVARGSRGGSLPEARGQPPVPSFWVEGLADLGGGVGEEQASALRQVSDGPPSG